MDNLQFIKAQLMVQLETYQVQPEPAITCLKVVTTPSFNLLNWLKAQTSYPQFYLNIRDGSSVWASVGEVCRFEDMTQAEQFVTQQQLPLLGGMQFTGATEFILPRVLLRQNQQQLEVSLFISAQDLASNTTQLKQQILQELQHFERTLPFAPVQQSIQLQRQQADQVQWCNWVEQGLAQIKQGALRKIVLANESVFSTEKTLKGIDFLAESERHNLGCYHFLFAKNANSTFLGSTPELLYRRRAEQLKTEALAGTAFMTQDEALNEQQGQWLLHDPKNEYENQLVVNGICEQLEPFVNHIHIEPVELKKLRKVQHLRRKIQAELKQDAGDKDILKAIHPTAAIAGLPQQAAQKAIQNIENFDRRWYAGTLGYISPEQADFCVTIRSAFIEQQGHQSQLHVFAGAGIVEGSIPLLEWQEIERKATSLVSLLQQ